MEKANLQGYAICDLQTSTVGQQLFGVKHSDIMNKELELLPSRAVHYVAESDEWFFTRGEEQVFPLERSSLKELMVPGI